MSTASTNAANASKAKHNKSKLEPLLLDRSMKWQQEQQQQRQQYNSSSNNDGNSNNNDDSNNNKSIALAIINRRETAATLFVANKSKGVLPLPSANSIPSLPAHSPAYPLLPSLLPGIHTSSDRQQAKQNASSSPPFGLADLQWIRFACGRVRGVPRGRRMEEEANQLGVRQRCTIGARETEFGIS